MGSSRNRRKRMEAERRRGEQRRRRAQIEAVGAADLKLVSRPEGVPKMSDTLVVFARPLLDAIPADAGAREYESALLVAATVWNFLVVSERTDDPATEAKLEELVRDMAEATGNPLSVVIAMLEQLAARKEDLFPDEDRIVARVHAEQRGDRIHVVALSAMAAH